MVGLDLAAIQDEVRALTHQTLGALLSRLNTAIAAEAQPQP
jgi:hypothetical protein